MFNNIIPGQPISVAQMKALADMVERSRGALTHGQIGQAITPGGTAPAPQIADFFTAKITEATGTGLLRIYSITEVNTRPKDLPSGATTRVMDKTSGRVAVKESQPARSIDPDAVYQVDDLVLVRRNVADVNEYEILVLLGRGSSGGLSTGGCSGKLGWLLDVASLTFSDPKNKIIPRAMRVAILESKGRCDCIPAPAGDSAALRFFDAIENPTTSPYGSDPFAALDRQAGDTDVIARWDESSAWEGLASLAVCCSGCANFTFSINAVATLLLSRPVFTMTVNGGCSEDGSTPSPKSVTLFAECGNDGYVILSGFDTQACKFAPTESQCVSLFRVGLVCVPCDVRPVGCPACQEKVAPPFYRVTVLGRTYYLRASGDGCSCTWTDACSGATFTVSAGALTLDLPSPAPSYVYDASGDPEGPVCAGGMTLTRVGASETYPETVIIYGPGCTPLTAKCCGKILPSRVQIAFEWTTTPTEIISTTCLDGDGNLWSDILVWNEEAYEDIIMPGTFYPGYTGTFHVNGDSYPVIFLPCYGTSEGASLFISGLEYTTTINCDDLSANFGQLGLCTGTYDPIDVSVNLVVRNIDETWWCVQDGDTYSCVQSDAEPDGATGPAHPTAEACAAACACASEEGGGMLMMAAPMAMRAAVAPKVSASRSRYLPLPTVPCKYLGELLTPCTSCGGSRPERDVYACEHPGNEEGRCTRGDPGKFGAWTCGGCPNYAP